MTTPYWTDGTVSLYLGDCRGVLPTLGVTADLVVADPPYGETSLAWDRWPTGWLVTAASVTSSLWCFGSMRMFLDNAHEFAGWKFSQDVIWEKQNGSGFATDRFKRVHEHVTHWYRGDWGGVHHDTPRVHVSHRTKGNASRGQVPHTGKIGSATWTDDGTRLTRSVIQHPSMWRRGAIHPTEKPIGILDPLIRYACPPGGLVVDPFAGSGSTLDAARAAGRRAIGIEANEAYAEKAARRLDQLTLDTA
ncbi:site-specific DNA-methyltransferase [Streptomyces sp.]|uniref:DNA-methyltransferase n=1 Tax=Streptomyces sp. TaxID=1931 RepID=UPI002F934EE0